MSLAIFDLDNTLLGDDSDYLWGQFLVQQKLVDGEHYQRENQRFLDDYNAGTLDIFEFLAFSLAPLARLDRTLLEQLHARFMQEKIRPVMQPAARALLDSHRQRGDTLMIITATNAFITAPIARALGVDELLATEPEQVNGQYTGKVAGIPCFREGKVLRLNQWLAEQDQNLDNSWFYSDSHNDLPLLAMVTQPVAVDPDPQLARHAESHGWPIISLRDQDKGATRST
ncbi:MAG: HAD family hydrolase [Gammaproteobacteria bacterium]|nr:HAD family hydrolase [Gammaproteobacteria bacterium]